MSDWTEQVSTVNEGLIDLRPADRPKTRFNTLSSRQEWVWSLAQTQPASPLFNHSLALRFSGRIHVAALQTALDGLLMCCPAFRTRFVVEAGAPVRKMGGSSSVELFHLDLSADPEQPAKMEAFLAEQAWKPFQLSRENLFRAAIIHLGSEEHILLLTIHHIAADDGAWFGVVRQLLTFYQAFSTGRPAAMPDLPSAFADFSGPACGWGDFLDQLPRLPGLQLARHELLVPFSARDLALMVRNLAQGAKIRFGPNVNPLEPLAADWLLHRFEAVLRNVALRSARPFSVLPPTSDQLYAL